MEKQKQFQEISKLGQKFKKTFEKISTGFTVDLKNRKKILVFKVEKWKEKEN